MLRLFILRHAKAEPGGPGKPDHDRALAERGRQDAAKLGAWLDRQGLLPERVVLSSARRVQETWQNLSPSLLRAPQTATEPKIYNASPQTLLAVVRAIPEGTASAAIVGHNPGLHELAFGLVSPDDIDASQRIAEGFPTTGLAILDLPANHWREIAPQSGKLVSFVTPKDF